MLIVGVIIVILFILWIISGMIFAFFSTNRNGNMNKIIGAYEATGDIPKLIAEQRKITHQKISKEFEIKNRDGINLHGYLIARESLQMYMFFTRMDIVRKMGQWSLDSCLKCGKRMITISFW